VNAGERQRVWTGLAFISPWLVGFAVFTVYPLTAALYYSFCDYDVLSRPIWVGLLNYRDMGTDDVFWQSLSNTLVFSAISLPLGLSFALVLALLLNRPVAGRSVYRAIYYLPSLVPSVAAAAVWLWILNSRNGLLNQALRSFGVIHPPRWLEDPFWTKPGLALMAIWGCGNTVVIFLAALQGVPRSLLEAATIDGASPWRRLWHIVIPAISPVIYFNLIMGVIGCLQTFATAFVMFTNGGPGRSVLFFAVYLYENAFEARQMGYACAMAWVLFLLTLGLTWLASRGTRGFVHYSEE
jgi:multiple sugar transport system permease protein